VDRIGTDWEEALCLALEHLTGLGHRRIGLVSLDSAAQPILSARRAFTRLENWRGTRLEVAPPILLRGLQHPTQQVGAVLGRALAEIRGPGECLPFTALVFLGISDAAGIRQALTEAGLATPEDLSVHILGHHDVPTEHFDTFTVTGSSHGEAAAELVAAIRKRLAFPALPPQTTFLSCEQVLRSTTRSVATLRQRTTRRSA
jgi:DNA-binding LacI/PurR family transcriptional regulator